MKTSFWIRLSSCCVALLCAATAQADVKLPSIFGDHMILQRGCPVPVWGWADKGEEVKVTFGGQTKSATADDNGKWMVKLDKLEASTEGRPLEIAGKNKVRIADVLVGDNWICSGQSNMEWSVNSSLNPKEEIEKADYPTIRLYDVEGHITSPTPKTDVPGKWAVCSPKSIPGFTAVGYFFGRRLNQESKVPIGLISTNWGGTKIEPWIAPEGFALVPELKSFADEAAGYTAESKIDQGKPTAIYNAMVYPLTPFAIRGSIWYQGESNGNEGVTYYHKMHALIEGWRKVFQQPADHPHYFYFVQLANYQPPKNDPAGGDGWAKVRDAQTQSLTIKNTGMATIIDIGDAPGEKSDIHPKNKQDVGERLAKWALRDVYGKKDLVVSGPQFKEMKIEDNKIRITYDHAGKGLMIGKKTTGTDPAVEDSTGKLARFAIAGDDKVWQWADAKIDGNSVVVSSDKVAKPVAVRYAWSMNPEGANLYNKDGLPAVPFRTDSW